MELILYTGQGCCLCQQAEELLGQIDNGLLALLKKVDVRSSSELFHSYGARIPVLYRPDKQRELAWPFNPFELEEFLL